MVRTVDGERDYRLLSSIRSLAEMVGRDVTPRYYCYFHVAPLLYGLPRQMVHIISHIRRTPSVAEHRRQVV